MRPRPKVHLHLSIRSIGAGVRKTPSTLSGFVGLRSGIIAANEPAAINATAAIAERVGRVGLMTCAFGQSDLC